MEVSDCREVRDVWEQGYRVELVNGKQLKEVML